MQIKRICLFALSQSTRHFSEMKISVFFLLLSICCCIQYKEPEKGLLLKLLRGSWIVSEYKMNVLDGAEIGSPIYHQINVTVSEETFVASVDEVDVRTGEKITHYFDFNIIGASVLTTKAEIVFPDRNAGIPIRIRSANEETIVR